MASDFFLSSFLSVFIWGSKLILQNSASAICSSDPLPASVLYGNILDKILQSAVKYPTLNAGAIDFEKEPQYIT